MTERQIQCALFREFRSTSSLVIPNYSPAGYWQCDLWRVTKAGYAEEYEIKLTVADFKQDAQKFMKSRTVEKTPDGKRIRVLLETRKHELVEAGGGPNRFWYVAPSGLLSIDMIPSWAGLREVTRHGNWLRVGTTKRAPELHKRQADQKVIEHAQSVFYWRFWGERLKNVELRKKLLDTNMQT